MSSYCSNGGPVNNGPCGPAPCAGECRAYEYDSECIGACGTPECTREDCRTCDACGGYFDADSDDSAQLNCDAGIYCGDCAGPCGRDCCDPDPDQDWRGDR